MHPVIVYHEQAGQPRSCLCGLARYAERIGRSGMTGRFASAAEVRDWLWDQPVLLDDGRGETERGCSPEQRSRVWPKDGMNCWEATAHWLGWHMRSQSPIEAHLFDTYISGQRHVFPAARYLDDSAAPRAIVLQPPPGWQTRSRVRAAVVDLAQALGTLPVPLRLVRTKSYAFYDDLESFVTEVGGDKSRAFVGQLPESVLQQLPPVWRRRALKFYPTANGDLLFEVVEPTFLGGTAYVIRVPVVALDGTGGSGGSTSASPPGAPPAGTGGTTGVLPPGAPPANCYVWARGVRGEEGYEARLGGGEAPANAWYNDLLGGTHYVGDKVLRAFGLGAVSDTLADAEGDALPDYARTDEQRKMRERERAAEQAVQPEPEESDPQPDSAAVREARALHLQMVAERYRQQQEAQRQSAADLDLAAEQKLAELRQEVVGTGPPGSVTNPIVRPRGGNL